MQHSEPLLPPMALFCRLTNGLAEGIESIGITLVKCFAVLVHVIVLLLFFLPTLDTPNSIFVRLYWQDFTDTQNSFSVFHKILL